MNYDISDRVEAPEFFDIPNYDYTSEIPPIEGTTDPRADWVAYLDEQEEYDMGADDDRAYAEMLERRAENGTWWGR
tara:strand:- start:3708 stop:3935 length:228 start_codon:yes stop_codon:yes gene_type:complete